MDNITGLPHALNRRGFIETGLAGMVMVTSIGTMASGEEAHVKQVVTSKDGTEIAYEKSGAGPALILVGGALSDRTASAPLAKLFAAEFTTFVFDRRGRGDSGDTPPYAVDREIEDLEALIDAAGGAAFIGGYSSGAVLALEAAARFPAKVTKLALYEPPFIIDGTRPPPPADAADHIRKLIAEDKRAEAVEYWMTEVVAAPKEAVAEMKSAPFWPALLAMAHTLPYDLAVLGDNMAGGALPAERWTNVTLPVLVMDGGASPDWIRHTARTLADALPDGQHLTLEGQTHNAAPEVVVPKMVEFFLG